MLMDDIYLSNLVRSLWGKWYWILVGGFLGGLLGLALSFIKAPLFESSAVISIGFDYARVNEMDDTVTNYVALRVRDLLLSDETALGALQLLGNARTPLEAFPDTESLRSRIEVAQDASSWVIVARAKTSDEAAAIANAWADSSLQALKQAMLHAIRASELQTAIFRAGCQLKVDPSSQGQAIWDCKPPGDTAGVAALPEALLREVSLSRGLLPAMSFSLLQHAQPPSAPVIWGRGGLILAGVLLGVWVAVLAVLLRQPKGDSNRRPHPAGDTGVR